MSTAVEARDNKRPKASAVRRPRGRRGFDQPSLEEERDGFIGGSFDDKDTK